MKKALIIGVSGQDGAYLARLLLEKEYSVIGLVRRGGASQAAFPKLEWLGIADDVRFAEGDLTDLSSLLRVLTDHKPDEVYNLAAQSVVQSSWRQPIQTTAVTAAGALNVLEALRLALPSARFFQASSSEMFGHTERPSQDETTPFHPRSPYAVAKLFAHWSTVNYRDSAGLHASSGIMFNHESPLRDIAFVTRKITDGVARIKAGQVRELRLGNLDSRRDWGHARDYVAAMHLMLQQEKPDDYVVATGRTVAVRDICRIAFDHVGLVAEDHVVVDPDFVRPTEVRCVRGDWSKAKARLGWSPATSLEDMIVEMVEADLRRVARHPA
ncbi:MAG TPA: GDP-mannose 4,6-dehydratase [Azospirillum sp.]